MLLTGDRAIVRIHGKRNSRGKFQRAGRVDQLHVRIGFGERARSIRTG